MWYHKINLWFTWRIMLYNSCFSFLSLALARTITDYYTSLFIFLTAGFIVGIIGQRIIHKREEYVFQNLAISNLQRYTFAYVTHIIIAIIAALLIVLIELLYV
ncbi:hypothetical protein [Nonlabens sp.]|uniref:hypothetical protein n=1 Tax=Nonlabens sp. TaxID=1888209 RepID=UPI0032656044